ncbi:hypothetical protein LTR85_002446 [Meristemomyces frigidus]|nr:hypothetical protein LTR85_002446 [Meristemomyces frigidus]
MAVTGTPGMPFRFFDLPRELRNEIYSELACDLLPPTRTHPYVTLEHYPSSDLRLINKQFTKEYEDEVLPCSQLVLYTHSRPMAVPIRLSDGRMFVPGLGGSALLGKIRNVTWGLEDCHVLDPSELKNFLQELRNMAQYIEGLFPRLKTMHVMALAMSDSFFSALGNKTIEPEDLFAVETLSRNGVTASLTLLLWARLFAMRLVGDPLLALEVEQSKRNAIFYRATRSDDRHALHGLDLATYVAGTYDYDAMVREAQDQGQDQDQDGGDSDDEEAMA